MGVLALQTLEKVKALRDQGNNKAAEKLADEQSLMYTEQVSLLIARHDQLWEALFAGRMSQSGCTKNQHHEEYFAHRGLLLASTSRTASNWCGQMSCTQARRRSGAPHKSIY